jgi:hypothetical protein
MYLSDLLNSRGFFQRCASWMQAAEFADDITALLNRATSATVSILRIEELQRRIAQEFEQFDDQLDECEERIVFNSATMIALQNEISPLLSSLRIMQDLIHGLVRRQTGSSLPRSISDTIKRLDSYDLPDELKDLYRRYWDNGGSRVREYRVLDQHYASIIESVFLQVRPSKKVLLLFPDNPERHAKAELTYDEEICGISILRVGFDELHEFVECIAEIFGYEPINLSQEIGMSQLGDLRPFRKRTIAFLYESLLRRRADGDLEVNISGVRFGQLEDGRLEMQKMLLSEEKLKKLKG